MPGRIETLDQLMRDMAEVVRKLSPMMTQELFNYRTIQTQHGQLMEENAKLKAKNDEIELEINKKIQAGIQLEGESKAKVSKTQSDIVILWTKAHTKFKEIEKDLDDMDKKMVKGKLKELEGMAV